MASQQRQRASQRQSKKKDSQGHGPRPADDSHYGDWGLVAEKLRARYGDEEDIGKKRAPAPPPNVSFLTFCIFKHHTRCYPSTEPDPERTVLSSQTARRVGRSLNHAELDQKPRTKPKNPQSHAAGAGHSIRRLRITVDVPTVYSPVLVDCRTAFEQNRIRQLRFDGYRAHHRGL